MFEPTLPEAGSKTLLDRFRAWTALHDPGGIDLARALHLGISFAIVIALGYATSRALALGMDINFPILAAMGSLVLISFTPAASVRSELRTMGTIFALGFAVLAVVALIGPGNGPANPVAQKVMLIPLAFLALDLRRYGMDGQRLGLALALVALVATVVEPTRTQALWLLFAFTEGALVALVVRFSLGRPSAEKAFYMATTEVRDAAAATLRSISDAVRVGAPLPDQVSARLEEMRGVVWNALNNAVAERPQSRVAIERLRVDLYRLRVGVQLLVSCIPKAAPPDAPWRGPFATAADHIARRLERLPEEDVHGKFRFRRALMQLRKLAFAPGLEPDTRFALLRAVTALERLTLIVTSLAVTGPAARAENATSAPPPRPRPQPRVVRDESGHWRLSAPMRVAIQGLVATGVTTLLDFALGLSHAYWATMTVLFVIGNSLGETYLRVRYRTFGTLIGVAMGLGAILLLPGSIWVLAGLCLLGQMVSIVTQRDRYDIASAAVGFAVVVGLHIITGLGIEGMMARVYETVIGAAVALLASRLVLPVYLADTLNSRVESLLRRCRAAFETWWPHAGPPRSVSGLVAEVRALDVQLPQLGAETSLGHASRDFSNIVAALDVLLTYLALLEDGAHRLRTLAPGEDLATPVEAARARTLTAFDLALGAAMPEAGAAGTPAVEAAMSTALSVEASAGAGPAGDAARAALPLIADYLAYSDAILRPLSDLGAALNGRALASRAIPAGALRAAPGSG